MYLFVLHVKLCISSISVFLQIKANRSVVSQAPALSHDISLLQNLACQQNAPLLCAAQLKLSARGSAAPANSMTSGVVTCSGIHANFQYTEWNGTLANSETSAIQHQNSGLVWETFLDVGPQCAQEHS